MTYTIDHIQYPDAATAAHSYGLAYDIDDYPGFGEVIAKLKYHNPDLTDDDITELAEAIHQHAHRPDQSAPTREELRRMVKGSGIPVAPPVPDWEIPGASLQSHPPYREERPASLIVRAARRLARR